MGPTASGKTDLAVRLVESGPFEIISVDSALVYRGMDIGTAKPDAATLARAPHRLVDILDPRESYSAARFRLDALAAISEIQAAGRIPLLVGGTMLYYRALQQGLSTLPPADATLRAQLEAECAQHGLAALHEQLQQVDPVAAARIHPHDTQRIMRALEVYRLSGRSLTELCQAIPAQALTFRALKLVLAPERALLHERIALRFTLMLQQGLVEEVRALRARGDLSLDLPAMRAVGYRQVWEHLDGVYSQAELKRRGIAATRQFAKRQLTWLRSETDSLWLDSTRPDLFEQVMTLWSAFCAKAD